MSQSEEKKEAPALAPERPVPRLNERILSSLSRRSIAAHPWHDLEIGTLFDHIAHSYSNCIEDLNVVANHYNYSMVCRTWSSQYIQLCKSSSSASKKNTCCLTI